MILLFENKFSSYHIWIFSCVYDSKEDSAKDNDDKFCAVESVLPIEGSQEPQSLLKLKQKCQVFTKQISLKVI